MLSLRPVRQQPDAMTGRAQAPKKRKRIRECPPRRLVRPQILAEQLVDLDVTGGDMDPERREDRAQSLAALLREADLARPPTLEVQLFGGEPASKRRV